jgi:hypothetical protein
LRANRSKVEEWDISDLDIFNPWPTTVVVMVDKAAVSLWLVIWFLTVTAHVTYVSTTRRPWIGVATVRHLSRGSPMPYVCGIDWIHKVEIQIHNAN